MRGGSNTESGGDSPLPLRSPPTSSLSRLCANDAVTAEMLLVLIEADEDDDGISSAAVTADAFGQLPLHWLCGSGSRDARALELLIDANPAALDVHDRHGLMPVHWL